MNIWRAKFCLANQFCLLTIKWVQNMEYVSFGIIFYWKNWKKLKKQHLSNFFYPYFNLILHRVEYLPAAMPPKSAISGVALRSCGSYCPICPYCLLLMLLIPFTSLVKPLIIRWKIPPCWTFWPFLTPKIFSKIFQLFC